MDQEIRTSTPLNRVSKGKTLNGSTPLSLQHSCLLLVSRSDPHSEFRVVLAARSDQETRGDENVLCFAFGQFNNTVAALGIGNPHVRQQHYRHCILPEPTQSDFWILCDPPSGWVALGSGKVPSPRSTLLTSRFSVAERPLLGTLRFALLSNYASPVTIETNLHAPEVARQCVASLQGATSKFDIDGNTIPIYGLTAVCALPPSNALFLIMSRIRDAIAAEPALACSYGLLPPSSFHMTIFDIISGSNFEHAVNTHASFTAAGNGVGNAALARVRSSEFDPLPDATKQYISEIAHRLERGGILQSVPWTTFAMRAVGVDHHVHTIQLEPWDDAVGAALDCWRERVAELTCRQNAPTVRSIEQFRAGRARGCYGFHMTIAYIIFPGGGCVEAEEARERLRTTSNEAIRSLGPIIVSAPHFCHFESMAAFHPVTLA